MKKNIEKNSFLKRLLLTLAITAFVTSLVNFAAQQALIGRTIDDIFSYKIIQNGYQPFTDVKDLALTYEVQKGVPDIKQHLEPLTGKVYSFNITDAKNNKLIAGSDKIKPDTDDFFYMEMTGTIGQSYEVNRLHCNEKVSDAAKKIADDFFMASTEEKKENALFYLSKENGLDLVYSSTDGYKMLDVSGNELNKYGLYKDPKNILESLGYNSYDASKIKSDTSDIREQDFLAPAYKYTNSEKFPDEFVKLQNENIDKVNKLKANYKAYVAAEPLKIKAVFKISAANASDSKFLSIFGERDYYDFEKRMAVFFMIVLTAMIFTLIKALSDNFEVQQNSTLVRTYGNIALEFKMLIFMLYGLFVFMSFLLGTVYLVDNKSEILFMLIGARSFLVYILPALFSAFFGLLLLYLTVTDFKNIHEVGIWNGLFKKSLIIRLITFPFRTLYNLLISSNIYNDDFTIKAFIILGISCGLYYIVIRYFSRAIIFILGCIIFCTLFLAFNKIRNYIELLEEDTTEMAEGNLDIEMKADYGIFNAIAKNISNIRNGFESAVQKEIKSRNFKTELITNVSHDLKTPLTSVITYSDLLYNSNEPEKQKEYAKIIYDKSERLKSLIEDLFEASKASSGNINLNLENLDPIILLKQTMEEMTEKIENSNLIFKTDFPEEKITCCLDGKQTYRIFSNLIDNIIKYSLKNTRVYISAKKELDRITFSFKNISAYEMNFDTEEISQRFVRGDKSRTEEGSGLGLAIAQSLAELEGGKLTIFTDADLFTAEVKFSMVN